MNFNEYLCSVHLPNRSLGSFLRTLQLKRVHNWIKEAKRTLSNSFPSRFASFLICYISISSLVARLCCVSLPWSRGLPFWPLRYLCTLNYCNWLLYYADQFKFGFWLKTIICVRDHKFDGFVHRESELLFEIRHLPRCLIPATACVCARAR